MLTPSPYLYPMKNTACQCTYLLAMVVCLHYSVCRAQTNDGWRLEKQADGIRVYSRFVPGKRLKSMKVVADMTGTPTQLVALFSDVDNYPAVIYKVKKAYLIRRYSESHLSYYSESEMPWPLKNRDLVIDLTFSYSAPENALHIFAKNIPDLIPLTHSAVRVPFWEAVWTVRPTGPNQMTAEYTFQVDPGGDLPAWLINLTAAVGPYQSFLKIQEAIRLPRYQHRAFAFMGVNE